MKKLWRKLMPFATDTNGASAVFAATPALVVAQDSNGSVSTLRRVIDVSAGKAAFETVDLPERSYTLGTEQEFQRLIRAMYQELCEQNRALLRPMPECVVLLNAPVSSLLGVDVKSRARELSEQLSCPVIGIETTGNTYYDKGIERAYREIYNALSDEGQRKRGKTYNVLGLTELDYPGHAVMRHAERVLRERGWEQTSDVGYSDSLQAWKKLRGVQKNLVVSAAGLELARTMERDSGIPYDVLCDMDWFDSWVETVSCREDVHVLIVGEQIQSNLIRHLLVKAGIAEDSVDVATFFTCDRQLKRPHDVRLKGESDFAKLISEGSYEYLIGDAALGKLATCELIALMHPPVGFGSRDGSELSRDWICNAVQTLNEVHTAKVASKSNMWDFSI